MKEVCEMHGHNTSSQKFPHAFSYPGLARHAVVHYLRNHRVLQASEAFALLSEEIPELHLQKACFVSIKNLDGSLRGCIGTLSPCYPSLMEELIANAMAAAFRDPRFSPVQEPELPSLLFSCDLLESPQATTFDALDPKTLGVIVSQGSRRGVLLPNLEGIDTPRQQVEIAMRKAGILETSLENLHLMSFRVKRHEE
jgi:AmmeMemoRadiSam system protein A